MKRIVLGTALALALAGTALAQSGDYMECAACRLLLGLVENSAGDGKDVVVDASRQCSLLPVGDREACARFYATMGPKFIKAIKERRARGESLESICGKMGYCGG